MQELNESNIIKYQVQMSKMRDEREKHQITQEHYNIKMENFVNKNIKEHPEDKLEIFAALIRQHSETIYSFVKQIKDPDIIMLWKEKRETFADTVDLSEFLNHFNQTPIVKKFTKEIFEEVKELKSEGKSGADEFDQILERMFRKYPEPYIEYVEKKHIEKLAQTLNKKMSRAAKNNNQSKNESTTNTSFKL